MKHAHSDPPTVEDKEETEITQYLLINGSFSRGFMTNKGRFLVGNSIRYHSSMNLALAIYLTVETRSLSARILRSDIKIVPS